MRQRGQVAARAQRALLVHHGQQLAVVHGHEALGGGSLHAAMAVAQALGLEEKHEAHEVRRHFGPGAAGVRHYQVHLQLGALFGRDAHVIQGAETSVDAVNRRVGVGQALVQVGVAGGNLSFGIVAKLHGAAVV